MQNLNTAGKRNVSLKSEMTSSDLRTQVEALGTDGQLPDRVFLRHLKVIPEVSIYTSCPPGRWDLGKPALDLETTRQGPS